LFEESLDKFGKGFFEIRKEVMPWKRMRNMVEYYYMWKTTDRYVQQKKLKANESESKLKQVYIPNYNNKQMNNGIGGGSIPGDTPGKCCESCGKTQSSLWYAYGPAHSNNRLCQGCWTYFKKFGGLRYPSKLAVQQEQQDKITNNGQSSGSELNNSTNASIKESSIATLSTTTNNVTNNVTNSNSTNDEAVEYKCKECNKTFNRQGNAHVVLNLMVKDKRNDEVDDFDLCDDCLSSKEC